MRSLLRILWRHVPILTTFEKPFSSPVSVHKPPPHDLASQLLDLHDTEFSDAGFGDQSSDDEPDGSLEEGPFGSINSEGIAVENSLRVSLQQKTYVLVLKSFRDWSYW